jgi:GT2 family glycosyltransferase
MTSVALPKVMVIVLNWCGEDDTIACIESLQRSTYAALSILLIDNASPDGSGDRLHARIPHIPYLQTGSNLGYAGGNNRGFERALADKADYVVVLNYDTIVDEGCISALVRTAEATGAALVAPKILYYDDPTVVWYAGGDFSPMRALGLHRREGLADTRGADAAEPISFATGCCFLIRSDVVRRLGGFDESYFAYVEDVELSVRIARAGLRMLLEPRARVLHRIPLGRTQESPFQIRQRDRNRRRLARTHFGPMQRIVFAAWFYPTRAIYLGRFVLRAAWPEAKATLAGAFGSLGTGAVPSDIRTRASSTARGRRAR